VTIRIFDSPEPLSDVSRYQESILAESTASLLLAQELRLYCQSWINGRSFLISGHRGAGKTTMVHQAFLRVWDESRHQRDSLRPLLVPLHGPNLLPARPAKPARGTTAETMKEPGGDTAETEKPKSETQIALEQITLGIYQALAKETSARFRERIREAPLKMLVRRERLELAAQLEVELYECPDAARLRDFWRQAGAMEQGVLFQPGLRRAPDQGFRELVALASASEAYRRIAGTYTRKDVQKGDDKSQVSVALGNSGKELFAPVASLLIGGLAGVGVFAAQPEGLVATAAGIASALGASAVFKHSAFRTRDRSTSREATFLFDTSVATLDRVLPCLIERLREAGLAPVFMVDELDKVDTLRTRMADLVQHLKKFVAENAFFCFLTDRIYFEAWKQLGDAAAYPVDYTYFTHQLYVLFSSRDLHDYLKRVLECPEAESEPQPEAAADSPAATTDSTAIEQQIITAQAQGRVAEYAADYPLLPYVLLHRSKMHAIDLQRELALLRGADGFISLPPGRVRTAPAFRVDLVLQIAIEIVLDDPAVKEELACHPTSRRLAHDALYYLSRKWQKQEDPDLSDGKGLQAFKEYLVGRMGKEVGAGAKDTPFELPRDTVGFLYKNVRILAERLSDLKGKYATAFEAWKESRQRNGEDAIKGAIDDALELDKNPSPLLEQVEGWSFRWCVDATGLSRQTPLVAKARLAAPHPGVVRDIELIETFSLVLQGFGGGEPSRAGRPRIDLSTLSSHLRILSTKPAWPETERAILQLRRAAQENKPFADFLQEVDCVAAYAEMLRRTGGLIARALFAGAVLGNACGREYRAESLLLGLLAISRAFRFPDKAEREVIRDLEELSATLRTELPLPADEPKIPPLSDKKSVDSWNKTVQGMLSSVQRVDFGELKSFPERRNSAWDGWFERLQKSLPEPGAPSPGLVLSPSLDDLVCTVLDVSPANLLPPNLGEMGIAAWSEALFRALTDTDMEADRLFAPTWLLCPALVALGFPAPVWQSLVDLLLSGKVSYSTRPFRQELSRLKDWALWRRPAGEPRASLLILRKPRGSGIEGWKTSSHGAAITLSLDVAERLRKFWPSPFGTFEMFVPIDRIAIEAAAGKVPPPLQKAVDSAARGRKRQPQPPLEFRTEMSGDATASAPLARSLDELFALHQSTIQRPTSAA